MLATPIDRQFPARVGVVPLAAPFDPADPASIRVRSVAAHSLGRALERCPQFSHVSDISTDLPNVGGLEGLRLIAARYRLRYLLLYSEQIEDDTHLNGWAFLYPTLLGVFAAPGVTVESRGLAQADLLDVRTGTVLLSVVEPMQVSELQWAIGAGRAHARAQAEEADRAAAVLARRVGQQVGLLLAWAEEAGQGRRAPVTRILPAPIAPTPTADAPAAAAASASPEHGAGQGVAQSRPST
ncbi:MAG: hypothetical protein HY744_08300 [Deltaproteobacteria bacterium]|nr:hypothetical protein [Deltaproteobacteria bacterium]